MENKEQDRFLPIANISRIMKKALPENAKIAKDAKETMQQCVSDFISFITSEACEKCINDKRKTINGIDLINAMNTLGFSNYIDILKIYLQKYREANKYNTQNIEENEAQSISKHEAELKEVDKHGEVYCLANLKANQEESNQYQQNLQQYQEHIQKMIMIQLNNQMQQQQLQIQQQQMQQQQQNNIPASQINQNKSILDEE